MGPAILGVFLAYLVGSIPSAYILVRVLKGMDIRSVGSRNVGALNAFTQLGVPGGVGVLVADGSKGAIGYFLPIWLGAPDWVSALGAAAALAGHNWPVFLRFRGGKGAATTLGIGLAMAPFHTLIAAAVTVALVAATRHVVFSAFVSFVVFDILIIATKQEAFVVALGLALTGLVAATYLSRSARPIVVAFRQRRWRDVVLPK